MSNKLYGRWEHVKRERAKVKGRIKRGVSPFPCRCNDSESRFSETRPDNCKVMYAKDTYVSERARKYFNVQ